MDVDAGADLLEPEAALGGHLRVVVVTPEGSAFDGQARTVTVPAHDGEVAFLPGHAPFVGALGMGELRVVSSEDGTHRWYLEGGVVQVLADRVTILAEQVMGPDSVDGEQARRDLDEALALVPTTPEAFEGRDRALRSARARIRLAEAKG
ncbi:MAG: ATP synthase F1 subunit epsilon [Planctomycetota bacterium]|jgi:F-type H+-transporting ATPase subunit epsilon